MTLLELCEPLFQYVCFLSRSARKGGTVTYSRVRADVEQLFDGLRSKAGGDRLLEAQFRKVELPLTFFVDSMVAESGLSFAGEWHNNRLAYDMGQLAGDERFFDLLDEAMAERGSEANERLAVYYVCLGLGFAGIHDGQPDILHRKMLEISDRIRGVMDTDFSSRICPDAYEHVDTRDLIRPPGSGLLGMGIGLAGLTVVLFITIFVLFRQTSHDLLESLKAVEAKGIPAERSLSINAAKDAVTVKAAAAANARAPEADAAKAVTPEEREKGKGE